MEIQVIGKNPLNPVTSFEHLNLHERFMKQVRKQNFEKPTPIQSQVTLVNLGAAHSVEWSRRDRNCEDWKWQDLRVHLAAVGARVGPSKIP